MGVLLYPLTKRYGIAGAAAAVSISQVVAMAPALDGAVAVLATPRGSVKLPAIV